MGGDELPVSVCIFGSITSTITSSLTNSVARHSYHSKYDHKQSFGSSSRYMYHCAQIDDRQHASV